MYTLNFKVCAHHGLADSAGVWLDTFVPLIDRAFKELNLNRKYRSKYDPGAIKILNPILKEKYGFTFIFHSADVAGMLPIDRTVYFDSKSDYLKFLLKHQ